MTDFKGKQIIVTAGASGIGHSIATSFIRAGATVHVVDVDERALEQFGLQWPDATTSIADVSSESAVDELFTNLQQHLPQGLDILVNCAGIQGPTAPVEEIAFEDWRRCVAVSLDGTFLCSRKAIPLIRKNGSQGRGSIINISSTAGWHGYPMRSPYSSAKWAVLGFTKSLAMELGASGIRVNAICPGSIEGERMSRVIAAEAEKKGVSEQSILDGYTQSCSMRTMIGGQDIADMALFLASDSASKVTGQAMNVDGHLESFAVS
ncbi:MAG: SDR family oxidoreductase [Pseudomonadales bacterium]